jgi:hypothetical protein
MSREGERVEQGEGQEDVIGEEQGEVGRENRGGRKTWEGRERGLVGGVLGVRRGLQEGVRHKL